MILSLLWKFSWQLIVLGVATYIGIFYTNSSKKNTASKVALSEARETQEIINFILKKKRRLMETYCEDSSDLCFAIEDRPLMKDNK
ncbi:hypothetical protein COOONC_08832 [Cooperia oncophora]